MSQHRIERDSMGELKVPAEALYGAQTQRAVENFPISGLTMPREFIRALGLIKSAAAQANADLGHLKKTQAKAIRKAAERVAGGEFDAHFPIDVFQTGSGTSSNMNANEVIAHVAAAAGCKVHPNDDVNNGQSSNDVIPPARKLDARSIASAAALVMVFFVLSRITGLVRDMVIAAEFNLGAELDAYQAAFRIPDLLFELVAGGALGIISSAPR